MKNLYVITLLSIIAGISLHAAATDEVGAIKRAIENKDRERVRQLVNSNNINIMHSFGTFLHFSIYTSNNDITNDIAIDLINRGADVNAQTNRYRNTALHYAVFYNNTILIQKLLESGANKDLLNIDEHTPTHIAQRKGYHKLVDLLNSWDPLEIKEPEKN